MADQILTLPNAVRGGSQTPIVNNLNFGANAWKHIQLKINSANWNSINGLTIGYSARVTTNGGITWTDWGGFTAVSPTFMKDGVTKTEPGGIWSWDPAFAGGGTLEISTICPTAFNWGATVTLLDT